MLTTTLNSKNLSHRRTPGKHHWFLVPILVSLFSGCAPIPPPPVDSFFELSPQTAQNQALQTRMFETTDEKELLSASAAVLQDLGFQIEESISDVGILRAAKERGAREYGQEINQALIALISTASIIVGGTIVMVPVDVHQQINATLTKGYEPDTITMDEAVALIAAKAAKPPKKKKAAAKKKTTKKKATKKKTATKKPAES